MSLKSARNLRTYEKQGKMCLLPRLRTSAWILFSTSRYQDIHPASGCIVQTSSHLPPAPSPLFPFNCCENKNFQLEKDSGD